MSRADLPGDIPASIEADVSELVFGKVIRVEDLPKSDKYQYVTDVNQPVAHITTVKEEVVAAPEVVLRMLPLPRLSLKSLRRVNRRLRKKAPKLRKKEKEKK